MFVLTLDFMSKILFSLFFKKLTLLLDDFFMSCFLKKFLIDVLIIFDFSILLKVGELKLSYEAIDTVPSGHISGKYFLKPSINIHS